MDSDFDIWNIQKKEIQKFSFISITPHSREVWWCSLGVNIGSEQNGIGQDFRRPVLILKKLSPTTFIVLPLSTKEKLAKFQHQILSENIKGYVLLDQVRVVDIKRFLRNMGQIEKEDFEILLMKFKNLL